MAGRFFLCVCACFCFVLSKILQGSIWTVLTVTACSALLLPGDLLFDYHWTWTRRHIHVLGTEKGPSLEPFSGTRPKKHRTWCVEGSSAKENQSALTKRNGWWAGKAIEIWETQVNKGEETEKNYLVHAITKVWAEYGRSQGKEEGTPSIWGWWRLT